MSIPVSISKDTENRWQEFVGTHQFSAAVLEKNEEIKWLWEQSQFCEKLSQKHPLWLEEIVNTSNQSSCQSQNIEPDTSEDQCKKSLRDFRNHALFQICWKDLILQEDIYSLLNEISLLADQCVHEAADWMRQQLIKKYGEPRAVNGDAVHLVVIAMGKLGGKELNFSSDIDVMFCYSDSGSTDGKISISNQEFFTQMAQGMIRVLSDVTADGFVYRVDCRLRPFGDSGPLVVNFNHIEDYLQSHGREWERYAFIKARVIVGVEEDRAEFKDTVTSFVYRKYIDFGVINTLREMKDLITQKMALKGNANNIKLGFGGIREIEFIVQFFQLVHGGQNPYLQSQSIKNGFEQIARYGYLDEQAVAQLEQAYIFLRRLENRLQMRNDEQTHVLPESENVLRTLAYSMNYDTVDAFFDSLKMHRDAVSDAFALIHSDEQQITSNSHYSDVWKALTSLEENESGDSINIAEFKEFPHVREKLLLLINSPSFRNQDKEGRQRLKEFIPCFLNQLSSVSSPALVIDRLYLLLQSILRRSAYLVLLYENQDALKQLIDVTSSSPWIASHITSYPLLLDELVASEDKDIFLTKEELETQFSNEVLSHASLDYEHILERVRLFKHARELRVACADVQNTISIMKVSDQLSWTAEVVIDGCMKYLERSFDAAMEGNLAVIGFGKLGGIELSYGSDLDLVYIAENEKDSDYPDDSKVPYVVKISKFGQRLTQMLTLQTVSGKLYDVDTRLRPDGESGAMVPPFDFVLNYYQSRAWVWELQALVRARCVAGSHEIKQKFNLMREEVICQPRDVQHLEAEVREMREKMLKSKQSKSADVFHLKNDEGGITDIEFMVQYAVLAHAHKDHALCEYSDNIRLLERLAGGGYISSSVASELTDIYCRFRNVMHHMALQSQATEVTGDEYKDERKIVRECWKNILGE